MKKSVTVIGVSDHYGQAILVSVTVVDGVPVVVDRREVTLLAAGLPASPYHHETLSMYKVEAEKLVKEVRESAVACADRALAQLLSEWDRKVTAIILREPPLPELPASVAEVHASYNVTNRADGMIYHEALQKAARNHGVAVEFIRRGQERKQAAQALGTSTARLDRWLADLRTSLGAPWQKDHQDSVARAIVGLSKYGRLTLP